MTKVANLATLHVYRNLQGRCYGAHVIIIRPPQHGPSIRKPNKYIVSVRTSDIHEAIAKTGTELWTLVEEALLSHEPHEIDEECEFEEFARDLLRVLTSHSGRTRIYGRCPYGYIAFS